MFLSPHLELEPSFETVVCDLCSFNCCRCIEEKRFPTPLLARQLQCIYAQLHVRNSIKPMCEPCSVCAARCSQAVSQGCSSEQRSSKRRVRQGPLDPSSARPATRGVEQARGPCGPPRILLGGRERRGRPGRALPSLLPC